MNIYRVNGISIDEDRFKEKIVDTLDTYKYASIEQLSYILKAKQSDIKNVLDEIIIWYVRQNPNVSYRKICVDLSVKSEFIEELVEEGRLEEKDLITDDIKEMEKQIAKTTTTAIKAVQRRETIQQLNKTIISSSPNDDSPKFHTLERLTTKRK